MVCNGLCYYSLPYDKSLGSVVDVLTGKLASFICAVSLPSSFFEWRIWTTTATCWYRALFPLTRAQNIRVSWPSAVVFAVRSGVTFWPRHRQGEMTHHWLLLALVLWRRFGVPGPFDSALHHYISLKEYCSSLQWRSPHLENLRQRALKLFWRLVVEQHLTKTLNDRFYMSLWL